MKKGKIHERCYKRFNCIMCGTMFYTPKRGDSKHSGRPAGVRMFGSKTCSKKCSRKFWCLSKKKRDKLIIKFSAKIEQ